MTEGTERLVRPELRSPRSAAIAGIVYSLLMLIGMILVYRVTNIIPEDITKDWLERWSVSASVALTLVPFAGIAFL